MLLTAIYGSPVPAAREGLWDYLGASRERHLASWMLIGDFNEILSPKEVKGGIFLFIELGGFLT